MYKKFSITGRLKEIAEDGLDSKKTNKKSKVISFFILQIFYEVFFQINLWKSTRKTTIPLVEH